VQGLEGLLGGDGGGSGGLRRVSSGARSRDENASPERRGPFLLPVTGGGAGGVEALQGRKALSESAALPPATTGGNGGAYQQAYAVSFPTRTPAVPVGGGDGAFDGSW
jgi:hypothetical protein